MVVIDQSKTIDMTQLKNTPPLELGKTVLLMAATLSLPGINLAQAETAPEHGIISYKYLDYLDAQSGVVDSASGASSSLSNNRVAVKANSLALMMPVAGEWSVSASFVNDAISGASPKYHSSELTKLKDNRNAGNISVTRYLPRGTVSVGLNKSKENDYVSKGFSLQGTFASEDKNTTLNAGFALSNDEIRVSEYLPWEKKQVTDWLIGVTQVLTIHDIAQFNLGYSVGNGYFSDPYKSGENRPESKDRTTVLARWNHYFKATNGASHIGYRYYNDTFGIVGHTFMLEYMQPFANGWSVMPLTRYYTQTAADFYIGLDPANPLFSEAMSARYKSLDQRLGEFGAWTWGVKVTKQLNENWLVDFKYEQYKQKESWALSGNGNGTIEPFNFRSYQVGISRKF